MKKKSAYRLNVANSFRLRRLAVVATATMAAAGGVQADGVVPSAPLPTPHSQQAYAPESAFTMRWTRADIRQIKAQSRVATAATKNSLPSALTMPDIAQDFPMMNPDVWVWDTWPLGDMHANQLSFKGWEVIFSLTADPHAGYTFDDRHVHARIGFFYRRAGIPASQRPLNGGWIWGGHLFPDGSSAKLFGTLPMTNNSEWSGSARLQRDDEVSLFYTAVAFNRSAPGGPDITAPVALIARAKGEIHADGKHVWFTGFDKHEELLRPDGVMYQTGEQNIAYSFRDPFVFTDPAHPGKTYMVFEGNTGGPRGARTCTDADMGYAPNDPYRENVSAVMDAGAAKHKANVGLAEATDGTLSHWRFLPPILSANCVDDQTERPQIYRKHGKYYLFTISHRSTMAPGVDGPDGLYGFVGDGIRSDFLPLNGGSGLVVGNPTDFDAPIGAPYSLDPNQNPRAFESYSHYVMPGGLVESFIDAVGPRRGGTLAPTIKIHIGKTSTRVERAPCLGYADIPANRSALAHDRNEVEQDDDASVQ